MTRLHLRAVLFITVLCLTLSGCATRLPERSNLASGAIPELDKGHARVFLYFGTFYTPSGFGGHYEFSLAKGMDGNIFIDEVYVSYVNEKAIVVDLAPGTYSINFKVNSELEEYGKSRASVPYQLIVNPGDTIFLKANIKDTSSQASAWLGGLGAVGGAIYGANVKFADYFEEDKQNGSKTVSEAGIADYCDLASRKMPTKTSSL